MNGEVLPNLHGFPVRMVVPGLYGYVSATKWLQTLEVTRYSEATAYWTNRGWSERGPVKLSSRIDVPGSSVAPGVVAVAGVAWAQHTGIARVQLQIDDGPWRDCELGTEASIDVWRQWQYRWTAERGSAHAPGPRDRRYRARADGEARGRGARTAPPGCTPSRCRWAEARQAVRP